jgi:antitoxin FitA
MARRVDDEIGWALKERPGAHGPSAEAEHRTILAALARARRGAFAEVLASMPDVGVDADFERVDSTGRSPHIFD